MNKAAQIYGYAVCTIAVIAFLIAMAGMVTALMDLSNPMYAGFRDDTTLASFENYKVEAMKSISKDAAYVPSNSELQVMYKAAKSELIAKTTHRVRRNLVVNSISIVACVILFFVHWKWMVRIGRRKQVAGSAATN